MEDREKDNNSNSKKNLLLLGLKIFSRMLALDLVTTIRSLCQQQDLQPCIQHRHHRPHGITTIPQ